MAKGKEEKERLRQERLARQREQEQRARVRSLLGYATGGILAAAVIAGIVLVAANPGGGHGTAQAKGAFGTHYRGLAERRATAGVPTMMDTMSSTIHIHPHIAVYVNGKQVEIPANLGIDPGQPSMQMAGLHTHDSSGTIHDEGMPGARLGQFFVVWGVPFSPHRLGPHRATGAKTVRMWVGGKPSHAFAQLPLQEDGQQIVVAYGNKNAAPPPLNP